MLGVCEKGSILMRGVTFSCGFSWISLLSVLFVHLMKGPVQGQLLKVQASAKS